MFEKEAIIYAFEDTIGVECLVKPVEDFTYEELSDEQQEKAYDFKKGAEFGYNKAKEEIEKLKELVLDCLFYCDHIDPYYNECLTEDNIFERAGKLGVKYE